MLREKLTPIVSIIFSLNNARERLDGMADMIAEIVVPEDYRSRNDE